MLTQSFGSEESNSESDTLTAVQFDHTGQYLATGDQGGRIVMFSRDEDKPSSKKTSSSPLSSSGRKRIEKEYLWRPYFQFQSHEVCFDFLKSQPIDEKINNIEILKLPAQEKVVLLTANDKTMKLWKVTHRIPHVTHAVQGLEKERGRYAGKTSTQSVDDRGRGITSSCLRLPTRVTAGANTIPSASPRQIFENGHSYHINSVSMNADGRTFLSADDLRINWWDLEVNDKCFNVLDMKPKCVEELTEVLTVARFHPTSGHQLVYATSKGTVSTVDTRISAICDYGRGSTRKLQSFGTDSFCADSFYSELISSISDIRYSSNDGRFIIARDYLSIKIWDSHMSNKPIKNIPVNNYLRPALTQLYESGCMYDKFDAIVNRDGTKVLTGSYSNRFTIYNTLTGSKWKESTLPGAYPFLKNPVVVRSLTTSPTGLHLSAKNKGFGGLRSAFTSMGLTRVLPGSDKEQDVIIRETMMSLGSDKSLDKGMEKDKDDMSVNTATTAASTARSSDSMSRSQSSSSSSQSSSLANSLSESSWSSTESLKSDLDEELSSLSGSAKLDLLEAVGGYNESSFSNHSAASSGNDYRESYQDFDHEELDLIRQANEANLSNASLVSGDGNGVIDMGAYTVAPHQKVIRYSWHPDDHTVAVASKSGLYIYAL